MDNNKLRLFCSSILLFLLLYVGLAYIAYAEANDNIQNLFVKSTWLEANRKKVVVVDARSEKKFKRGHLPRAVSAPWQLFTHMNGKPGDPDWGTLLPKGELIAKLAAIGINGQTALVVYADTPGWGEDGRFAWMVLVLGIKNVKILDGGIKAWKKDGGEITRKINIMPVVKKDLHGWDEDLIATTEWIQSNTGKIKIVDARSKKEFKGAVKYGEDRGGHLPEAIFIPFRTLFNFDGTIKKSSQLKQLFRSAGLKPEDEIVAYCTAGIRASYMTLVMRMAGFKKVRNYDASFYEWAAKKQLPLK